MVGEEFGVVGFCVVYNCGSEWVSDGWCIDDGEDYVIDIDVRDKG